MNDVRMGYLVELHKKNGLFGEYRDAQKVLMRGEKLAELLTDYNKFIYFIISATSVDIPEYQLNHDEKLEEWI